MANKMSWLFNNKHCCFIIFLFGQLISLSLFLLFNTGFSLESLMKMAHFICSRISSTNIRHCDKLINQTVNRPLMQLSGLCGRDGHYGNRQLINQVCRYLSTKHLLQCGPANTRHSSVVLGHDGTSKFAPSRYRIPIWKPLPSCTVSHNVFQASPHKAIGIIANQLHTSAFRLDMNVSNNKETSKKEVREQSDMNLELNVTNDQMSSGESSIQDDLSVDNTHVNHDRVELDVLTPRRDSHIFQDFQEMVTILDLKEDDELDILSERQEPKVIEEFTKPPLMPSSYTLASYVEHSEVLQKLVQLGVDLSKVEKRGGGVADKIIKLNFEPQVAEKISFLNFVGVESNNLGKFLTKNPHILLEDQENLEKRVKYLMAKKFDKMAIAQMVNRAPYLLCFSVSKMQCWFRMEMEFEMRG